MRSLFSLTLVLFFCVRTECVVQGKPSKLWLHPLNDTHLQSGSFPRGFLWGVGTSAFPTEGSWDADGKGESVWDRFTHHSSAGTASNSYIQWEDDIKSAQSLGVNFYAFSLSWPRLFPNGDPRASANPSGVEHYRRLILRLKELGVEPLVTLFHWDLPQVLQERFGGWLNGSLVDVFADYAAFCFRTFGSEVRFWLTMRNPFVLAVQGYGTGAHAPGHAGGHADPLIAAHNLIRAHAKAWHVYDKHFRSAQRGKVSISLSSHWVEPLHGQATPTNQQLCQKAMEAVIGWFAEPIYGRGDYPESLKASNRGVIPEFTAQEREEIRGSADFFSLALELETLRLARGLARFGQTVALDLRSTLVWVQQSYGDPEILLAESGWFSDAAVGVEDTVAIYLMKKFIMQVLQAVSVDGVRVFGYTAWALVDGFEWNLGLSVRRGLFFIDFSESEPRRLPKTSALFYRRIIRDNGLLSEHTPLTHGRFPCGFQFGMSESVLQVHLRPFSPQFTDPLVYRWNFSGDGALKPVTGVLLHTRPSQCTEFLFIQRHLFLLGLTGASHHRFALDWAQLMPSGDPASADPVKVRFYRCVFLELRRRGVQPLVTLYHRSNGSISRGLPEKLHAHGGWRNTSAVEAFVRYAEFCFREFGEFVRMWITIDEPNRLVEAYGENAEERRAVARQLLLAHAKAWHVYDVRFRHQQGALISLALHANWVEPDNPFVESHKVAQQHYLLFELGRFLDPLIANDASGHAPSAVIGFTDEERAELKGTLDFIALNHFTTHLVSPWKHPKPLNQDHGCLLKNDFTWPASHLRQALVPWGLRRMLGWVKSRYGNDLPIIITASGVDDQAPHNDQLRQSYIRDYLQEALKAHLLDGVNLRGFYLWKLQDHQDLGFGLFSSSAHHSRPKASVHLYQDIIRSRGFPPSSEPQSSACEDAPVCALCSRITENTPLLFFSACVCVSVLMLSALTVVTVMKRRRRRMKKIQQRGTHRVKQQRIPMVRVKREIRSMSRH